MLRRISTQLSYFDLVKQTLWNVVLYFVYFSTLLFWMRLMGVNAQGNRGVVINNQKIDESSVIHQHVQQSQPIYPSIATKFVSSSTSQVIICYQESIEQRRIHTKYSLIVRATILFSVTV